MSTVSAKGRETENKVIAYLRSYGLKVERRRLAGVHDRGDVAGWETDKGSVCVEIKTASGGWRPQEWARELDAEADAAAAETGFIVARPKGKPDPEDYLVVVRFPWFMEIMREAGYLPPDPVTKTLDVLRDEATTARAKFFGNKRSTAIIGAALLSEARASVALDGETQSIGPSFRGAPSDGHTTRWKLP